MHQPAVCAACCASRSGSGQGGNEPAGSNDRPDARNGQKAEPGQRAERATGNGTESRTSSGRLDSIIFAIEIAEGAPPDAVQTTQTEPSVTPQVGVRTEGPSND